MKDLSDFFQMNPLQSDQYNRLENLYREWNEKINLISRKDMDHLYERHVLHSLSIAKVISFKDGTAVLDAGTGGGFPGIPLAIMFPSVQFTLVDSIGKKILVVNEIIKSLGLKNAVGQKARVEEISGSFDFVVSRAVADLSTIWNWVGKKIRAEGFNDLPNGLFCLKGGDLNEELSPFKNRCRVWNISDFFAGEFFQTKKILFIPNIN